MCQTLWVDMSQLKKKQIAALLKLPRRTPIEILTRQEIDRHFVYAPSPCFCHNGVEYAVRLRRSKAILFEDEFGSDWRPRIAQQVIEEILRDQSYYQAHQFTSRYWVHSAFFPPIIMCAHDGRKFYKAYWLAARVV